MHKRIEFVLSHTTHSGNIGSSARAIKNMGFCNLTLINPQNFPSQMACNLAAGADDILENAKIFTKIEDAIADCSLIIGASARHRALQVPLCNPQQAAIIVKNHLINNNKIAILFGTESSGLTNQELNLCHYQLAIDSNPDFSSLNLSQAVQIVSYELRNAIITPNHQPIKNYHSDDLQANSQEVIKFYQHLQQVLTEIDFIKEPSIIDKIRHLYNKSNLTKREINILRGILTAFDKKINKKDC